MEDEEDIIMTSEKRGYRVSPVTPSCPWSPWPLKGHPNPHITEAAAPSGPPWQTRCWMDHKPILPQQSHLFLWAIKCFRNTESHISLWGPDRTIYRCSITFCKDIHWHYPHIFHKVSSLLNLTLEKKKITFVIAFFLSYKGLYFQPNLYRRNLYALWYTLGCCLQSVTSFYSTWSYHPQSRSCKVVKRLGQIPCSVHFYLCVCVQSDKRAGHYWSLWYIHCRT